MTNYAEKKVWIYTSIPIDSGNSESGFSRRVGFCYSAYSLSL